MCKSVPLLGSVTVELTDELYSTSKILDEIRIVVEKETGSNVIISVIYRNDISCLNIIKHFLEQCTQDVKLLLGIAVCILFNWINQMPTTLFLYT